MALWMKRRMAESQRKNGLNDTTSEMSCEKPVERQFNYNSQSWPSAAALENEMGCVSMPTTNDRKYQAKSTNLDRVQKSVEAKKELKYQPSVPQALTQSDVMNCNLPEWTISDDNKNISVTAADRGDSNVMAALPQGAYYEQPIYIDPMTYQQQQANSINIASNPTAIPVASQLNLAPSYRCANADCVNCKSSLKTI